MFGSGIYHHCPFDPSELQTYLESFEDYLTAYWHGAGETKNGRKQGVEDFHRLAQPFLDDKGIPSSVATWEDLLVPNAVRALCQKWFDTFHLLNNCTCQAFCTGFCGWCLSELEARWDPFLDALLERLFQYLFLFNCLVKHPWAWGWRKWHSVHCILELREVFVTRYRRERWERHQLRAHQSRPDHIDDRRGGCDL